VSSKVIYDVECQLDPDIVADYDAWLPGHVRDVLSCAGFLDASIHSTETPSGERPRRRIQYRVESLAALDQYLENHATRLRTETAERFGGRVQCERRVYRPREEILPARLEPPRCLNCGAPVIGKFCSSCGQSGDVHVVSMREVAGDFTHSLLHLDGRVWQTIKLLALKPGELTREFIAGRHQSYLPPFRLYLGISILFFALSALLPDGELVKFDENATSADTTGRAQELREDISAELANAGVDPAALAGGGGKKESDCNVDVTLPLIGSVKEPLSRACRRIRADGGKLLFEHFIATAPKLMFLFLPLMASVAMLFYWRRPRRLYIEHLVLFLHDHAFTFLLLGAATALNALSSIKLPLFGFFGFLEFLLILYLPYYVFRSMRVTYAESRLRTSLKFAALAVIYLVLLGVTMLAGFIYAALALE
jgi:Protein of unknown function (DUF3667)/Domain of unknown function (DUF4286)